MSALTAQRYALGRAVAMVRDRPLAFLLGVALAAIALALPLAIASVLWAARPALTQIQPAPEVSVFVSTRASPRDVDALKGRLEAVPGVAEVTLRPKDAALAQLIKRSGFVTTPAELGANPLPDVLILRLQLPVSEQSLDVVTTTVKGWPLVDSVRSDLDWYRKVQALARLSITAVAIFGGLVVLLVTLILVGTVRPARRHPGGRTRGSEARRRDAALHRSTLRLQRGADAGARVRACHRRRLRDARGVAGATRQPRRAVRGAIHSARPGTDPPSRGLCWGGDPWLGSRRCGCTSSGSSDRHRRRSEK